MYVLTILALFVASFVIAASLMLYRKLRDTEAELERTRHRMARLDEFVEEVATREFDREEVAVKSTEPVSFELGEVPVAVQTDTEPARQRIETPPRQRVDSGDYVPVGLDFDTDSAFEEAFNAALEEAFDDDFAAPRMAATVREDLEDEPLAAPRRRLDTPVVTPRNTLPPGSRDSILAVGSIQVSSDAMRENSKD